MIFSPPEGRIPQFCDGREIVAPHLGYEPRTDARKKPGRCTGRARRRGYVHGAGWKSTDARSSFDFAQDELGEEGRGQTGPFPRRRPGSLAAGAGLNGLRPRLSPGTRRGGRGWDSASLIRPQGGWAYTSGHDRDSPPSPLPPHCPYAFRPEAAGAGGGGGGRTAGRDWRRRPTGCAARRTRWCAKRGWTQAPRR